jgi:hypothetical protein
MRLLVAACLSLVAPALAGQNVGDNLEYSRQSLKAQKRTIIGGSVAMSEKEASAFWPLHDAYENERDRIDGREAKLIAEFVAAGAQLTDARARTMLDEVVGLREERLALKKRYVKRFGEVLSPKQLMQYFQLDSKLDALLAADLARAIPLVR